MSTHDALFHKITKNSPAKAAQVHIEALKMKFIENLVELRELLHLSQVEIAKRIGMKQQVISRIENGENITINTLLRYMDGLHNVAIVEKAKIERKNTILQFMKNIEASAA